MRPFLLLFLLIAITGSVAAQTSTNAAGPSSTGAPAGSVSDATKKANLVSLRQASDLARNGNPDAAIAKVTTVIQSDPRNILAYSLRAQIYNEKKMYDKADTDYETAHMIDPSNLLINFDLAEMKFQQKMYDAARPMFVEIESDKTSDLGDLAAYKVFLCDLFGGHADVAAKELATFNDIGANASYYYANAASDLFAHKTEDARGWLASASRIYSANKNNLYSSSLLSLGYLPLPPAPAAQ